MARFVLFLSCELETFALASSLAKVCSYGCIIYLNGQIGLGKTSFCRGFLRSLGYVGHVKSPTYTFIESYIFSNNVVHHIDLYRLHNVDELECIGIWDYIDGYALCLIEWPKIVAGFLPMPNVNIFLHYQNGGRRVVIETCDDTVQHILIELSEQWEINS